MQLHFVCLQEKIDPTLPVDGKTWRNYLRNKRKMASAASVPPEKQPADRPVTSEVRLTKYVGIEFQKVEKKVKIKS